MLSGTAFGITQICESLIHLKKSTADTENKTGCFHYFFDQKH